jgi:hypothetical protein
MKIFLNVRGTSYFTQILIYEICNLEHLLSSFIEQVFNNVNEEFNLKNVKISTVVKLRLQKFADDNFLTRKFYVNLKKSDPFTA